MRQLQQQIDSPTFALYLAYNRVDPFGRERGDLNAGIISSTLANVWGNKTQPTDFMIDFAKENQTKQSPEDMLIIAKQITTRMKGTIN